MLNKLVWTPELSTGDERIDAQHKDLIDFINFLADIIDAGEFNRLPEALAGLRDYSENHFKHEEACFAHRNCPMGPVNQAAHREFVRLLDEFSAECNATGPKADLVRKVFETLRDWFVNHVSKVDTELRNCSERT